MPKQSRLDSPATLREAVVTLGDLVRGQLRRSLTAIDTLDPALARTVIEGDAVINDLYLDLEGDCINLLALQQPVAGDLRTVVAAFKILTDLERIGDLAANLATLVRTLVEDVSGEAFAAVRLVEIGEIAAEMVADALYAFDTGDAALCHTVVDRDQDLNDLCNDAMQRLVRDILDSATLGPFDGVGPDTVREVLVLVRDLERVGDHATNVAARTYYMLESDDSLLY